jgi:tetratricopeptide (TPR) repeat protein
LDSNRHEWLLNLTGVDNSAIEEMRAASTLITASDHPDVVYALRLGHAQSEFHDRNRNLPIQLPTVWAKLGNRHRAQALARAFAHPYSRAKALVGVAEAIAEAGQQEEGIALAIEALEIYDRAERPRFMSDDKDPIDQVLGVLLAAGRFTTAVETVLSRPSDKDKSRKAKSLASVARAMGRAGHVTDGEALSKTLEDQYERETALCELAEEMAHRGDLAAVENVTSLVIRYRERALWVVAWAKAKSGQLNEAVADVNDMKNPAYQRQCVEHILKDLAERGLFEAAFVVAQSIKDDGVRLTAYAQLSIGLTKAGETKWALRAAQEAVIAADSIVDPYAPFDAAFEAVTALVCAGQKSEARQLVERTIATQKRLDNEVGDDDLWNRSALAEMSIWAREYDRAEQIVRTFASNIDSLVSTREVVAAVTRSAELFAIFDEIGRAEQLLDLIPSAWDRGRATESVAVQLAIRKKMDRAESFSLRIGEGYQRANALASIALIAAGHNFFDLSSRLATRAEQTARSIRDPDRRIAVLRDLVRALLATGASQDAIQAATAAEAISRKHMQSDTHRSPFPAFDTSGNLWRRTYEDLVEALTSGGLFTRAKEMTLTADESYLRQRLAKAMIEASARNGDTTLTRPLLPLIELPTLRVEALLTLASPLSNSGLPLGRESSLSLAEEAADSIEDFEDRARALIAIALARHSVAGQRARAIELIGRASGLLNSTTDRRRSVVPRDINVSYVELCGAFAETGQYDAAYAVAVGRKEDFYRDRCYVKIVTALAADGNLTQAKSLTTQIRDGGPRASALCGISKTLITQRRYGEAADLAQQAWSAAASTHTAGYLASVVRRRSGV